VVFALAAPHHRLKEDVVHRLPPMAVQTAVQAPAGEAETVVLAGGCFWGVQGVFAHVRGVREAISGYAGGQASTADYESVSSGRTGHAESVKIVFDPHEITFAQVLQIFFSVATDPTQLDQQFPDQGPQYRSEIFYTSAAQKGAAAAYIAQLDRAGEFSHPIVTRLEPLRGFFQAEAYHQDYLVLHPNEPYIASYDLPKVAALQALFPEAWRAAPVLALGQPSSPAPILR
jgi:peptide-methionine (S)-S-oxide reductase